MRFGFLFGLLAGTQMLAGCTDLNSPIISYFGIATTAISSNSISIAWNKASDGRTTSTALVYKVYISGPNPLYQSFNTIGQVEAGTLVATLTDAASATISTGIAAGNFYYINIVVQDEVGNKNVYDPLGEYFDAGQVAYYPFSGSAVDVVAANNLVVANLTPATGTTLTLPFATLDRFGHPASAYSFAPTATASQCLQSTTNIGITGTAARTVSFWVQSANTTTPATQRVPFAWGDGSAAGSSFGVYETGIGNNWTAWLGGASVGDTGTAVTTSWEHWVIGYDGANVLTYKNGAAVTSSALAANTLDGLLYVGCAANPAGTLVNPYLGKIDDLRIFNVAPTAINVANLYDKTRP